MTGIFLSESIHTVLVLPQMANMRNAAQHSTSALACCLYLNQARHCSLFLARHFVSATIGTKNGVNRLLLLYQPLLNVSVVSAIETDAIQIGDYIFLLYYMRNP